MPSHRPPRPAPRRRPRAVTATLGLWVGLGACLGAVAACAGERAADLRPGAGAAGATSVLASRAADQPPETSGQGGRDGGGTGGPAAPEPTSGVEEAGTELAADDAGDDYFPGAGAGGIDVQDVSVALEWQPPVGAAGGELRGRATITVAITEDRRGVQLDLTGMEVRGATLDGADAPFEHHGAELLVGGDEEVRAGSTHTVTVTYAGEPRSIDDGTGLGIEVGWVTLDDGSYVFSEPVGARTWLPVNDHPSDKARYRFAVTVPDPLEVTATGVLQGQETGPRPETTTWHFEARDPVASYLVSVATGDFDFVTDRAPVTGVPIRHAFPAGQGERYRAAFSDTGAMIDTFSRLFGPYPFEVYGALVVDVPLGYAEENQTLSLFGTDTADAAIIAHELAHQWFGDAVSLQRWQDVWLKEGFATYAESLWFERHDPAFDIDATMRGRWRDLNADPQRTTLADPGLRGLYGEVVYQRGALTLHALRRTVGDDAFFAILQAWVRQHDDASATTQDFTALASRVAGRPLDGFFHAWLETPALPALP